MNTNGNNGNRLQNTGRTHFQKGVSPNPGGRPKGLASLVRERTKDGKQLVETMLKIADGSLIVEETRFNGEGEPYAVQMKPRHGDIIKATEWLADRGFGKSPDKLELLANGGSDIETQNTSAEDSVKALALMGIVLPGM